MKSAAAEAIRAELQTGPPGQQAYGRCSDLRDEQLDRVVAHVGGDVDLAVSALRMRPWPPWMMGVLYPARTSAP